MSDQQFMDAVHTTQLSEQLSKKLVAADEFGAESNYLSHDWKKDSRGDGILKEIEDGQSTEQAQGLEQGQSDLQQWLRGRQQEFEKLVAKWESRAKRSAGRSDAAGDRFSGGVPESGSRQVQYGEEAEQIIGDAACLIGIVTSEVFMPKAKDTAKVPSTTASIASSRPTIQGPLDELERTMLRNGAGLTEMAKARDALRAKLLAEDYPNLIKRIADGMPETDERF